MDIRVMVLDKDGNQILQAQWKKAGRVIKASAFDTKIHRHLSGRPFTSDEVKWFNVKTK